MESNVNSITFLVLIISVMLAIIFFMLSTILYKIKTIYRLIEEKNNLETPCTALPIGFEKVKGINTPYRKRYVYVKNFIAHDEFFVYDTKTGQLVKVNLDPKCVDTIQKNFEPKDHVTLIRRLK